MKNKENKQKEALERNEAYAKMTLDQKIQKQVEAGKTGKQLQKLLKQKEEQNKPKEEKKEEPK